MTAIIKDEESWYSKPEVAKLADIFTKQINLSGPPRPPLQRIGNRASLDIRIPSICQAIHEALSSRQCEATYQSCLALDLEESGITVAFEVPIHLTYKGRVVGTRRADLIIQTNDDNARSVLEIKALSALTSEHLKQLEFYMHYMSIDVGYLINFPHDTGFPDARLDAASDCSQKGGNNFYFLQSVLAGPNLILSDHLLRGKNENAKVQIIKVTKEYGPDRRAPAPRALLVDPPREHFGVTKQGLPCKICLKQRRFCSLHVDQDRSRAGLSR